MYRRGALRHDTLGAVVVSVGVVALLGLSVLIGPRPVEPPAAAPAPVERPAPPAVAPAEPEPEPEPEPVAPPLPLQLRIAGIDVEARVVAVGIEPNGAMEIPEDVREVGWYDPDGLGVRPGTLGTAVFASHVDSRSQGRGVLFELRRMRVDDTFEIDLEDGTTQTWRITEVAQIPKTAMPLSEIFTWAGPSRVVIITCGGEFDRARGSYVDNIVVYAEPLDAPAAAAPDAPTT
jgi:hypothetical protein